MDLRKTRKYRNRKKWVASVAVTVSLGVAFSIESSTNVKAAEVSAAQTDVQSTSQKDNVSNEEIPQPNEYEKVVSIHRYSEPTGQYANGSFKGLQVIQDEDKDFGKATKYNTAKEDGGKYSSYSSMGVGYKDGKTYTNIWGGDSNVTIKDTNTISVPTTTKSGYIYDNDFQQKADPDHYYDVMEQNGKADINFNKVPSSSKYNSPQAYHIYYKKADQPTYQLKANTSYSYQAVLNWFDYDNGYYLGSTVMNDYSMGLGGFLQDKDWPTDGNRNNTDYIVYAPKNYQFTTDDKNEFGIDSDTKHPFIDVSTSKDKLHEGIFHENEWANWGQYDSRGNQVHTHVNGNNIHFFRLYVKYEGKPSEYRRPTETDIEKGVYAQEAKPTSYTIEQHTTDPNYRQLLLRIIDFDSWKSIKQIEIPINITESSNQTIDLSKIIPSDYRLIDVSLTTHTNILQKAGNDIKYTNDGTPYAGLNSDGTLHVGKEFDTPYLTENYFTKNLGNNGMSAGYREVYVRKEPRQSTDNMLLKITVPSNNPKDQFVNKNGNWYYFDSNGHALTNGLYKLSDGFYHYFNNDGVEVINGIMPANGTYYYFDKDGHAFNNGLIKASDGYLHYYNKDYSPAINKFVNVNNNWYYFDSNGHALTNGLYKLSDGFYHYFNNDGVEVINGWVDNHYFDNNGHRL